MSAGFEGCPGGIASLGTCRRMCIHSKTTPPEGTWGNNWSGLHYLHRRETEAGVRGVVTDLRPCGEVPTKPELECRSPQHCPGLWPCGHSWFRASGLHTPCQHIQPR